MKKRAIVWGHKLHTHTQSYVHYGFYRAFKALGHEVLWLDNNDDVSNIDFENCIFITEGQVDAKIPLRQSSKYIVHSCNEARYAGLTKVNIQIFHGQICGGPVPNTHHTFATTESVTKINDYTFVSSNTVWQPWATDLLPDEIDLSTANNQTTNLECVWIGTYGDRTSEYQNSVELDLFFDECRKHNIRVNIINPWVSPVSPEENRRLVNESFMAPAIQGPWQIKHGYTPQCRILKNISYGHMGIVNNPATNALFDGLLACSEDPTALFYKALEKKFNPKTIEDTKYLMNEVKTKHTYVNRLQTILAALGE